MKILIADDHSLFRDGLRMHLKQLFDEIEVMETQDFAGTFKALDKNKFDLLILDLDMPDAMPWEEAFALAKQKAEGARMAVISASDNNRDIKKAMDLGAIGYIPKRSDPKILSAALKLILDGGIYLPPEILNNPKTSAEPNTRTSGRLTARQMEVLKLIAQGRSNKQIAFELQVSEATIKLHINALLRTLGATNRTQALIIAQKEGII